MFSSLQPLPSFPCAHMLRHPSFSPLLALAASPSLTTNGAPQSSVRASPLRTASYKDLALDPGSPQLDAGRWRKGNGVCLLLTAHGLCLSDSSSVSHKDATSFAPTPTYGLPFTSAAFDFFSACATLATIPPVR